MHTESKRSRSLEYTLGIIIALGLIASFVLWQDNVQKRRAKGHAYVRSVNNLRLIGLALFEFDMEYGSFPSDSTKAPVTKAYTESLVPGGPLSRVPDIDGTSSNASFRQLFAANITRSEPDFYARIDGCFKPDDDMSSGHLLEPGECGFSYISGLSSKEYPTAPIVLTPLIPGTTKFDPKPFDGKAVVLFIDMSARTFDIHKDGHIYDKGINLLSPKHPVWKGKAPDIRYPDL